LDFCIQSRVSFFRTSQASLAADHFEPSCGVKSGCGAEVSPRTFLDLRPNAAVIIPKHSFLHR
jgi:hypothetical protein